MMHFLKLKLLKIIKFFLFLIFIIFLTKNTIAVESNYCSYNKATKKILSSYNVNDLTELTEDQRTSYDIEINNLPSKILILDDDSISSENEQTAFNGATDIYNSVDLGERLIVYQLSSSGSPIEIFDQCKPGCPKTGWLSEFLGSECIRGQADADEILFKTTYFTSIFQILEKAKAKSTNENHLIDKISFLSEDLSNFSDEDTICIFSNLVEKSEYGDFTSLDSNIYDQAFVKAVIDKKIPRNYKKNVIFYGVKVSPNVRNFWTDIFSISKSEPKILTSLCTQ